MCSKLTKRHKNDVNDIILVSLLLNLNRFYIVGFEQANAGCKSSPLLKELQNTGQLGVYRSQSNFYNN